MKPWLRFFYVVASMPGTSALDVDVPTWAMPQITIATHDLWIEIATADAVLLRLAVSGFGGDEGDGTFGFDLGGRFRLDEFAGANYPHIRHRWIELCAVEVKTELTRAALDGALDNRRLASWPAHSCRSVARNGLLTLREQTMPSAHEVLR